jgi:alcohol dehydrogenase (cytochrome c)
MIGRRAGRKVDMKHFRTDTCNSADGGVDWAAIRVGRQLAARGCSDDDARHLLGTADPADVEHRRRGYAAAAQSAVTPRRDCAGVGWVWRRLEADRRAGHRPARMLTVLVVLAFGALVAACGGGSSSSLAAAPLVSGSWPYPNADLANTRDAPGSMISSKNVARLRQAWKFALSGPAASGVSEYGSLAAAPIVEDGVVYIQDLDSNVYALALRTGKLKWQYKVDLPEKTGPGPDGVAVVDGFVYGDSSTTAFALSSETGKPIWRNRDLLGKGQGSFEIQPQVANGRVYLASAYGSGPGGGVLFALDASSGRLLWRFNTMLGEGAGVQAIGAGAGGAWETPLVGGDGSVTYGIGNPYQSAAAAIAKPSKELYSDSDVNLDATTGRLRWYYQGVTNDFKDYDMQISPISTRVNGTPAVLGAGKMGYVYAMDAKTGRLIWKTPVGEHNGHDNDSLLALEHRSAIRAPYSFLPGALGGVLTNMAVANDTVYVATIDSEFTVTSLQQVDGGPSTTPTGEVEALSLGTGKVEWDTKLSQMALGATTVSNDLVFTTLYNGVLIALNRSTGAIVSRTKLPTSTNAPVTIAGNTVLVPAGAPTLFGVGGGQPQLVAYTVP